MKIQCATNYPDNECPGEKQKKGGGSHVTFILKEPRLKIIN